MVLKNTIATVLVSINGHSQKEAIKIAKRALGAHIYDVISEVEIETILVGGAHPLLTEEEMPIVHAYLRKKIEKSLLERGSTQCLIADYCSDQDTPTAIAARGRKLRAAQKELRSWESFAGVDVQVILLSHGGLPIAIAQ